MLYLQLFVVACISMQFYKLYGLTVRGEVAEVGSLLRESFNPAGALACS